MRTLYLIFGLVFANFSIAQNVGINPSGTSPDPSAALDVDFTNKGLLIPRVALTSTNDAVTIPSPQTSLLVYNTGTGGLSPAGFYFNNGTPAAPQWVFFVTNNNMFTNSFVAFSTGNITANTTWQVVPGMTLNIVVPAGRTAKIKIMGTVGLWTPCGTNNNSSCTDLAVFRNGALVITATGGAYRRICLGDNLIDFSDGENMFGHAELFSMETLGAGTYTYDLRCRQYLTGAGSCQGDVGGNNSSVNQGVLLIDVMYQ